MKITKEQLKQIIKEEINEIFGFKKKEDKETKLTRITMEDIMKELGETTARSLKNDPSNAEQFENLNQQGIEDERHASGYADLGVFENLNEDTFYKDSALKHLRNFVVDKLNADTVFPVSRDERQAAYAAAMRDLANELEDVRGVGSPL